jgi:hypothetical protein
MTKARFLCASSRPLRCSQRKRALRFRAPQGFPLEEMLTDERMTASTIKLTDYG